MAPSQELSEKSSTKFLVHQRGLVFLFQNTSGLGTVIFVTISCHEDVVTLANFFLCIAAKEGYRGFYFIPKIS
jgi:hypothetical protein